MAKEIVWQPKLALNAPTKKQTWQGREYLVAPVIILVEGVHNGSGGPALYTAEELSNHPSRWDGVPVVVDHPYYNDGTPASANSPEVIEKCEQAAREEAPDDDELHDQQVNRIVDRIATYCNVSATVVALEYLRYCREQD